MIVSLAATVALASTYHSGRGSLGSKLEITAFGHAPALAGLIVATETVHTVEVGVTAIIAGVFYSLGFAGASYKTISKWPFYLITGSLVGALVALGFLGLHETQSGRVALLLVHLGLYHHVVVLT